ncbi:MAG TPA: HAMP domain-containing sensor histidine kinase [Thermoflexus sp.]|nr:HAMP domain-containing sensor histidine kinase [Thermoflexus sp.]
MTTIGTRALEALARELYNLRDPQEIRRTALKWAATWAGASDGAFLVREREGWRGQAVLVDPAFWEREWGLMEPKEELAWHGREGDAVNFLPIPVGGVTEWLGLRGADPKALADGSAWRAAGFLIALALSAAQEREARAAFFSTAVHELRLPMTSIKGYADLLLKGMGGSLTETQRRFLETIRSNIDRLAGLVQDLLEHSRMETGRLRLRIEPVALDEALQEAMRRVQTEVERRGHVVRVELPEVPPQVPADRERLIAILSKILDNAVKYTPLGGEIWVRAMQVGSEWVCEISDNGIGIAPEDQEHLFTPFWRSEDPRVREVPGFGLSLAVARGLLRAMGGGIEIESQPERGTSVRIRLPSASSD